MLLVLLRFSLFDVLLSVFRGGGFLESGGSDWKEMVLDVIFSFFLSFSLAPRFFSVILSPVMDVTAAFELSQLLNTVSTLILMESICGRVTSVTDLWIPLLGCRIVFLSEEMTDCGGVSLSMFFARRGCVPFLHPRVSIVMC